MSIKRDSLFNIGGSIVPVIVSLVTVPAYLSMIGEERYGILAMVWLLLGYFGLFDFGMGRAVAQRLASEGCRTARASALYTAITLNVVLGCLGGLLMLPLAGHFFADVIKVSSVVRTELAGSIFWLGIAVPIATVSGVLTGGLQGSSRFFELNLISIIGNILFQVLPLVAVVYYGADLRVVLPVAILAKVLTLSVLTYRCYKHLLRSCMPRFSFFEAKTLMVFGGWVMVTSIVGPLMVVADRLVIGAVSGAKAVSYYTVPFQLAQRSSIFSNALISALFPRFASLSAEGSRELASSAIDMLTVIMTPLIAVCILSVGWFLSIWISPEFSAIATLPGQIILAGFWINAFAGVAFALLQAQGRPDLVAKCHLAEVLPYLVILYYAIESFGLVGAAIIFLIRTVFDCLLLMHLAGVLAAAERLLVGGAFVLFFGFFLSHWQKHFGAELSLYYAGYALSVLVWLWIEMPKKWKRQALRFTHIGFLR